MQLLPVSYLKIQHWTPQYLIFLGHSYLPHMSSLKSVVSLLYQKKEMKKKPFHRHLCSSFLHISFTDKYYYLFVSPYTLLLVFGTGNSLRLKHRKNFVIKYSLPIYRFFDTSLFSIYIFLSGMK